MLQASVWLGEVRLARHDEPDWPTTDQSTPAPDGSDCRSAMTLTVPEVLLRIVVAKPTGLPELTSFRRRVRPPCRTRAGQGSSRSLSRQMRPADR